MSSGTYFPPPVLAVEIPKAHGGGTRTLGVPTVADRVAQTVAALTLRPRTESIFHDDSYGYRPRRSAVDAVATCRRRCFARAWVIDVDVAAFFDSVPWDRMVQAVAANITTDQRWVLLYVKRWLSAPLVMPDGTVQQRDRGTPQGSAISPVRGCPAFRGTSVAAHGASGCDDLLIVHGGADSSGDFGVERGAQLGQVQVTVDPTELLAGLDHAGGAPAQRHLPVAPALDVGRVGPADGDHALDRVGRAQGAGQRRRHFQAQHGEGLGESLAQAASRTGVGLVQFPGQRAQLGFGVEGGVGVVGLPHLRADRAVQPLR